MFTSNNSGFLFFIFCGIISACVFFFLPESDLLYNRDLINAGPSNYYRLISCHFVHANMNHFLLNLASLLLVALLYGHYFSFIKFLSLTIASGLLISLGIYLHFHYIGTLCGLSAIIHFILTMGALKDISQKMYSGFVILLFVVAKVYLEQSGIYSFYDIKVVAFEAHMLGIVSAFLMMLVMQVASYLVSES